MFGLKSVKGLYTECYACCNREEKCDVTLPWWKNYWIRTIGSLTNDDSNGNKNGKKEIGFYKQNNNAARASRFCTFLSRLGTTADHMKLLHFTRPLQWSRWTQHKTFSKHRHGPFGFNPRLKFPNIRQKMKFNKIDEVWNSANSLFKWYFRFAVIQKKCCHGNVT